MEAKLRQLYRKFVYHWTKKSREQEVGLSVIVISPHMDDETLGCGGTIIKRRQAGNDVRIVFMTDGSRSHNLISPDELKALRIKEAIAAGHIMGVEKDKIIFLNFEDGNLKKHHKPAIAKLIEIFRHYQPDEVFIPYHQDIHVDHIATHSITLMALNEYGKNVMVYEYPIWFWNHWPWIKKPLPSWKRWKKILDIVRRNITSELRLLRYFKYAIKIEDVINTKRLALDQHKSQVTRLIPDPRWLTLYDASDGKWLECFFQEYEMFYRYQFSKAKTISYSNIQEDIDFPQDCLTTANPPYFYSDSIEPSDFPQPERTESI